MAAAGQRSDASLELVPAESDNPQDRQRYPRTLVLCSADLRADGETAACEVLNISAGGAKVRLQDPLACEAEVSLTIGRYGIFPCRVAWRDGLYLGLEFLGHPDKMAQLVDAIIDDPDFNKDRRIHARRSVLWSGRLHAGGRAAQCRVLNVSVSGAKLHLLEPLQLEAKVSLVLDRFGEFPADVVWRDGKFLGIKFHDDPDDIAQIFGAAVPALRVKPD